MQHKQVCWILAIVFSLAGLTACGGGGGSGGNSNRSTGTPPPPSYPPALTFETPSSFASISSFATGVGSVDLTGDLASAFVPGGLCPGDVSGLDFEIRWTNLANGTSGTTPIAFGCVTVYIAGEPVPGIRTSFDIGPIALEMGSNRIEMSTYEDAQQIGRDVVTVIREDRVPPTVVATFPAALETGIPSNRKLLVRFDKPMLKSSLTSERFRLEDASGAAVDAQVRYNGASRSWILEPTTSLSAAMSYTATIDAAVTDRNGNELGQAYSWNFSTGADDDLLPPTLVGTWPGENCLCAPTSTRIMVRLDEPLDPVSANDLDVEVSAPGMTLDGDLAFGGDFIEFIPTDNPVEGVGYTISITGTARDLAGNRASLAGSSSFTLQSQVPIGTWTNTELDGAPEGLVDAQTVWTGSEVLFWRSGTGLSFDPVANRWNDDNAFFGGPSLRPGATAVWSGGEMIIWGEHIGDGPVAPELAGSAYNPTADSWRDILVPDTATSAITSNHAAIWTGNEMIVWGGSYGISNTLTATGWRYQPGTETLVAITSFDAPSPRRNPQAIWTGTEMIVWGGFDSQSQPLKDGGIYNPTSNEWRELPALPDDYTTGQHAKAVWSGQEMIVWNGGISRSGQSTNNLRREPTLYRFDPVTDSWKVSASGWEPFTVTTNRIFPLLYDDGHFVAWTGEGMLVVPRFPYDPVYLYDPLTDSWQEVADTEDFGTKGAMTIWAGDRLVQWGGRIGLVFTESDGLILEL